MSTLSYGQARTVVLGFGSALICGVALAAFFRGADVVEVLAVLLFLPVLLGLGFWMVRGGALAGILAAGIYLAVRFSTLGGLPAGDFLGIGVVRLLLYVGLGVFGGWANAQLANALRKLELYDEVDDLTGVGNARAVVSVTDRETARADRYGTLFSVLVVSIAENAFAGADARRARKGLRQACQTVEASVRGTDLVNRVRVGTHEHVVVFLPETGRQGAEMVLQRLVPGARQLLSEAGLATSDGSVEGWVLTYPGDEEQLHNYIHQVSTAAGLDRTSQEPS